MKGFVELAASSKSNQVAREPVVRMTLQLAPTSGYHGSLLQNLVSEGVLSEELSYSQNGLIDVVRITYERFADHLLAEYLLDRHLDSRKPRGAFRPRGELNEYLSTELECWQYAGLIEALSVQLPERVGRELVELAPHAAGFEPVKLAFIKSLTWRTTHAFQDATNKYFESLLRDGHYSPYALDAMLVVAPVPDHPLNADRLHRLLAANVMPRRDQSWSTFLHNEWGTKKAVDRLVEWAWNDSMKFPLLRRRCTAGRDCNCLVSHLIK